jgi:hypothetical protein
MLPEIVSFSSLHGQSQEKEVERNAVLRTGDINERHRASTYRGYSEEIGSIRRPGTAVGG